MTKIHADFHEALQTVQALREKYDIKTRIGQMLAESHYFLAKAGATAADPDFRPRTGLQLMAGALPNGH